MIDHVPTVVIKTGRRGRSSSAPPLPPGGGHDDHGHFVKPQQYERRYRRTRRRKCAEVLEAANGGKVPWTSSKLGSRVLPPSRAGLTKGINDKRIDATATRQQASVREFGSSCPWRLVSCQPWSPVQLRAGLLYCSICNALHPFLEECTLNSLGSLQCL